MVIEQILEAVEAGRHGEYKVAPEDFRRLERRLSRVRWVHLLIHKSKSPANQYFNSYTYNLITESLLIKMPAWAHSLTELWLQNWVGKSIGIRGYGRKQWYLFRIWCNSWEPQRRLYWIVSQMASAMINGH